MPKPTREEVEEVFKSADKDKSGKLSFEEFKSAYIKFAENEKEEKQFQVEGFAEMIFDVLGGDKDKELSVDQVMDLINGGFDQKKMMTRMLQGADKDGDGYISTEELRKMAMMMDPDPEEATDMANMIIKMCGGAKEKKVKPEAIMEFFGLVTEEQDDPKQKAKTMFKMFDTNGDGYINTKELTGYMQTFLDDEDENDPMMKMMMKMMIAEHDKDEDGKLNFDEFCNLIEKN